VIFDTTKGLKYGCRQCLISTSFKDYEDFFI
jgi:hypothetical protein